MTVKYLSSFFVYHYCPNFLQAFLAVSSSRGSNFSGSFSFGSRGDPISLSRLYHGDVSLGIGRSSMDHHTGAVAR